MKFAVLSIVCVASATRGSVGALEPTCTMHTKRDWCIKGAPEYDKTHTASAADCCAACQLDTRCESWVFGNPSNSSNSSGGKCRLKNATAPGEPGPPGRDRCAMAGSKHAWPGPPSPPPPGPRPPSSARPNFILVLTDDMDIALGGVGAVPQVQRLLGAGGATATNCFVSSPKCAPSRTSYLSGRYVHNLLKGGEGNHAGGLNETTMFDRDALFPTLRRAGYKTAIFGKVHNTQMAWLCTPGNHTEPFDHIETPCHATGAYYAVGNASDKHEWVTKQTHDDVPRKAALDPASIRAWSNYTEAQYGNRTVAWVRGLVERKQLPFFAYIGTPGPHAASIPAWWHRRRTASLTHGAPRTPNFNALARDHHPLLSTAPALDKRALAHVDKQFRARWGTLFAIDDMVAVQSIDDMGLGNSTYIMLTSDHGFHLGQFRIPQGKEMPYETDIRVPFFCRGPGIAPGTRITQLIANIDIAPTLCALAGLPVPPIMDGRSFAPLMVQSEDTVTGRPWRTHFLIEFYDGSVREWGSVSCWDTDSRCATDLVVGGPWGPNCTRKQHTCTGVGGHGLAAGCPCEEGGIMPANPCSDIGPNGTSAEECPHRQRFDYLFSDPRFNWRALRVINTTHNFTFIQFVSKPNNPLISPIDRAPPLFANVTFSEYYDLHSDEWQMSNRWPSLPASTQAGLVREMEHHLACAGTRTTPSTCE